MSPKLFFGKPDTKTEEIRKKLMLALETRVDFNIDFFMNKRLLFQMKGGCTEVQSNFLKIYLRGDKSYVPPAGIQAHVYFSLREGRRTTPHDFLCELVRTEKTNGDPFLIFSMPTDMGQNQRRYNVRIPADRGDIRNFKVWYGKPVFSPNVNNPTRLQWMPFESSHVDVFDISAGGMQLGINVASDLHPFLSMREMLLVSGEFETRGKQAQQLAMVGSVVRILCGDMKKITSLGLRFRRWGVLRDGKYHWLNLSGEDGVPPLGAWVFQIILIRSRLERERILD